ncbi:MAG TPA: hypothetical protein VGK92_07405 [Gaiellales bacterium]
MAKLEDADWWAVRRAQNRSAATYRCPLCGHRLHAGSEHSLIAPEGDASRRRHAHSECVLAAREQGRLPLREDWLATQPRRPSLWRRLLGRGAEPDRDAHP